MASATDTTATDLPGVSDLLAVAVEAIGGTTRPGQVRMAEAVDQAIATGEHLAVQAGTGTGKSLAYLVPAVRYAVASGRTVVVSTATIALQRQLVDRDLPRLAKALQGPLGRAPEFAILKGRANYLCVHRVSSGAPEEPDDAGLFDPAALSRTGKEVKRLHEWASETVTGDRDELVPGVSDRAWRQVSVTAKECLGAAKCPLAGDCFAEHARAEAGRADVVVTNHALLAIDALQGRQILPEHDLVIVDEAHDLVDRVTSSATAELTAGMVATAARRCGRLIDAEQADLLMEASEGLSLVLGELPGGRLDSLPPAVAGALRTVRDAAHGCITALGPERREDAGEAIARKLARTALDDVHDTAVRMLEAFDEEAEGRSDVVWRSQDRQAESGGSSRPPALYVAPLSVAGLLRERLFGTRTTVLTSATLALGGTFDTLAMQWGLPRSGHEPTPLPDETKVAGSSVAAVGPADDEPDRAGEPGPADPRDDRETASPNPATATAKPPPSDRSGLRWRSLDVGSPFDYARNGILYVARRLPPPGRDGLSDAVLDELTGLVEAAGGRTLGLFSSMRAAKQAADELRQRVGFPILCQGDDATGLLVRQFADNPRTCLFGTLSLWQGVDVPGPSLQLVVVDRIPFPRPDDPVQSARQRAVEARGGNGFLTVAAAHAALLLAQGVGRLHRSTSDRGVVAVLDSRLANARYSRFLRASLPPFWPTTDPEVAKAALRRLDAAAKGAGAPERPRS
ncbi:MAG: ATP-dependent DNA helicase [Thermocrispum agreste]|uniref:ATP-dependent helicase DinG n=2 Tax=Thermocrispum agreste TaxID=37925 RepID=A0ABD6FDC6_9PSEU